MDAIGRILETSPPAQPGKNESRDPRDWRYALVCGAATLAAIALTWPIAESGVNDDWSYTKTAMYLAQTGRFCYYGWAVVMIGAQAWWGALFIELFGSSFLAVRLSTAPLAAGCAVLAYGLHRRAGLPPRLALFGALTLALSPVFVPNAASFMTDIPSLFLFLASVYGYVRIAGLLHESETDGGAFPSARLRFWKWLSFALTMGLLAGTVRQTYWLLPVLAPLYIGARGWVCRSLRCTLIPLVGSAIFALAAAIMFSLWFSAQPNMTPSGIARGFSSAIDAESAITLSRFSVRILLTLGAMALPVAIALPWLMPKVLLTERKPWLFVLQLALLTLILYHVVALALDKVLFPWLGNMGNMFVRTPLFCGATPTPLGGDLRIFSRRFWRVFGVGVIILTCVIVAVASLTRLRRGQQARAPLASRRRLNVCLDAMPVPLALLAIFAAAYLPFILLKSLVPDSYGIFDRHLLPVLPGVTIALLTTFRAESGRGRLPRLAWLVLALFAFYGIAQTHDYFAQLRARVSLTTQLESRGIPRTRIMAGFEYDLWTQITVAGRCGDPHSHVPPLTFETGYTLWQHTPVICPDYVVSHGRHSDLLDTDLAPAVFHCWLPPFRRELVVQTPERGLIRVNALALSPVSEKQGIVVEDLRSRKPRPAAIQD